MHTLLALRHAKSSHADDSLPDHDRPLNERGRRDAPRLGHWLAHHDLVPHAIVCSTSQRTIETAELVADACGFPGAIQQDERLYLASEATILRILARQPDRVSRLMLVGHNPGLEDLIERLTGVRESMSTAALARIELPMNSWSEIASAGRGSLEGPWRARDLDELE